MSYQHGFIQSEQNQTEAARALSEEELSRREIEAERTPAWIDEPVEEGMLLTEAENGIPF